MAQWVKTLFENVATTAMPHQGPCLRGMDTGTRFSSRTQTIALAIRRFYSLNILKVSLFIIVWAFVQMYHNTGIRSAEDSFQKCGCRRQLRPSCLVAASTFTCWAVLLPHDTFFQWILMEVVCVWRTYDGTDGFCPGCQVQGWLCGFPMLCGAVFCLLSFPDTLQDCLGLISSSSLCLSPCS